MNNMKKFRFKDADALTRFRSNDSSTANQEIANTLALDVFMGELVRGQIERVTWVDENYDLFPDYSPIFFDNEVKRYLVEVCDEPVIEKPNPDIEKLLAENMDLRARITKLETRLNRLEKLV